MAKLTINVAPKAFTPTLACLELVTDIYKDTKTLEIDMPLSSVLGTFFYVRNKCGADIVLPETSWANNTENGGDLNLKSLPTNIPANSITKVFMSYNGTYKGDAKELIYTLSLNNTMANYAFTTVKKIVNIAPASTDINILLKNRENFSFVLTTFLDKFRDADGDALTHVKLTGYVPNYTLNNTPYVAGTEIAIADVVNLKFIANDINDETTSIAQFQMKSSDGTWSNVSNITIKNAVFVAPVVVPVTYPDCTPYNEQLLSINANSGRITLYSRLQLSSVMAKSFGLKKKVNGVWIEVEKIIVNQVLYPRSFGTEIQTTAFTIEHVANAEYMIHLSIEGSDIFNQDLGNGVSDGTPEPQGYWIPCQNEPRTNTESGPQSGLRGYGGNADYSIAQVDGYPIALCRASLCCYGFIYPNSPG